MLGSSNCCMSLRFPHQNPVYSSMLSHTSYMPSPSYSYRFNQPKNIGQVAQIIKNLIMQISPLTWYLVPLGPKYSHPHPVLKHPQPTILHQCERPSITLIYKNMKVYCSVYFNLQIFGQQTERQKNLHWMIAGIPWYHFALNFFLNRIFCVKFVPKHLDSPIISNELYQYLYCDFVLHSDIETWPCK